MTAREKALRLHTLMYGGLCDVVSWEDAKRCALIAVDEMIFHLQEIIILFEDLDENDLLNRHLCFYEEVKKEIGKL